MNRYDVWSDDVGIVHRCLKSDGEWVLFEEAQAQIADRDEKYQKLMDDYMALKAKVAMDEDYEV